MDHSRRPGILALIAIVVGVGGNVLAAGGPGLWKVGAWLATLMAMALVCAAIGLAIKGYWLGTVMSARNRLSLSRLQMLGWTLLVLSALATAAASNFAQTGSMSALAIDIPGELLAAMGIAATSMVAAPALLSLKAASPLGRAESAPLHLSSGIHVRESAERASWLDIFRGDEMGNCDTPDLSKIQQFLITLVLILLYGVLIGGMLYRLPPEGLFAAFPKLSDNVVWLLGVSHAGYLAYKAVPHPAATGGGVGAPGGIVDPVPVPPPAPPAPPTDPGAGSVSADPALSPPSKGTLGS